MIIPINKVQSSKPYVNGVRCSSYSNRVKLETRNTFSQDTCSFKTCSSTVSVNLVMSSHSAKRKDSTGAGTSQEDSRDPLSGNTQIEICVWLWANHKFFAKPLHTTVNLFIVW